MRFASRLPSVFLTVLLLASTSGHAKTSIYGPDRPQTCDYVLREAGPYELGDPNPDYNFYAQVDDAKSVGMADVPVFNQREYGCCWITAELGHVCRACAGVGKNIRPLDTYLAAISILERAVHGPDSRRLVVQGGNTPYAVSLLNRYGVIPEGALVQTAEGLRPWKPTLDFQKGKNGDLLIEQINAKLVTYFDQTNELYVELQQAANRKSLFGIFSKAKADPIKVFAHHPEKLKLLADARKEYDDALNEVFNRAFGSIPENFVWEGKSYTPLSFLKENVPPETLDLTLVVPKKIGRELPALSVPKVHNPKPNPNDIEYQLWNELGGFHTGQDWKTIDAAIERSLAQKPPKPVRFGISIKRSFIDKERGIMSIDAFARYPGFREEVERMNAAIPNYTDGGHAILITKIYRNRAGETIGYRIQNSWGDVAKDGKSVGEKGYFVMDTSYMRTFEPSFFFEKGIYETGVPVK